MTALFLLGEKSYKQKMQIQAEQSMWLAITALTYKKNCNSLKNAVHSVLLEIRLGFSMVCLMVVICCVVKVEEETRLQQYHTSPLDFSLFSFSLISVFPYCLLFPVSLHWVFCSICNLKQWKIDATCSWASATKSSFHMFV